MSKNNGGSAFPYVASHEYSDGMSLRDYFAAQAMVGYLISTELKIGNAYSDSSLRDRADHFYRMADAMIAARKS